MQTSKLLADQKSLTISDPQIFMLLMEETLHQLKTIVYPIILDTRFYTLWCQDLFDQQEFPSKS